MKKILLFVLFGFILVKADVFYELQNMAGWTIVGDGIIVASKEPGEEKIDSFEGCNGRTKIYFDNGAIAECLSLGLQLKLMPEVIIFKKEVIHKNKPLALFKMLVDDKMYDIAPLR